VDRLSILEKILWPKKTNLNIVSYRLRLLSEAEKAGFERQDELIHAIELISNSTAKFMGLMTMAPIRNSDYEVGARQSFATLQRWRDQLCPKAKLSMGMSGDYLLAIEHGSQVVRLGSNLFSV
jgi:PLP dependent protein